jgi:hypothetical protein
MPFFLMLEPAPNGASIMPTLQAAHFPSSAQAIEKLKGRSKGRPLRMQKAAASEGARYKPKTDTIIARRN